MSYFAEKCSNCKNYNGNIRICESCAHYDRPMTVFERITASLEVLAEEMVFCIQDDLGPWWTSNILNKYYNTRPEAVAATVEKLKEVEVRSE